MRRYITKVTDKTTYVPNKNDIIRRSQKVKNIYSFKAFKKNTVVYTQKQSNNRNTGRKKKSKPIKRKLFRNKCVSTPQFLEEMKSKRRK